jgi:predicted PhzF superfamily epimerase YddE/YHI9
VPQPIYLVDAFAHERFTGNPAGVCPLDKEPDEDWMQGLAMEMNQAETAFFWPEGDGYRLRWFSPTVEIALCGHATLATAHVLYEDKEVPHDKQIRFATMSGDLVCRRTTTGIEMDFPNEAPHEVESDLVGDVLGVKPVWMGANKLDWCCVVGSEQEVYDLAPDMNAVIEAGLRGIVVTAKTAPLRSGVGAAPSAPRQRQSSAGEGAAPSAPAADQSDRDWRTGKGPQPDFVSRFFAPQSGVPEDPVTGSAHCALGPYWSKQLGKNPVLGYQASKRGGYVQVETRGDRVALTGHAHTILRGHLHA